MQDYLSGLNEKQKEAVLYLNGPLMIVAGAGSGKTKVLTTRIAHLMQEDGFKNKHITYHKLSAVINYSERHLLL